MRPLACFLLVAVGTAVVAAQTPAYRAPRVGDGRPDLNGIWQANTTAQWNLEAHSAEPGPILELGALGAVPGGPGVVEGDTIPYRPEALATRQENNEHRLERDPAVKCYLPGVPRATYMGRPFQIVQSASHVMILHEFARAVRTVYMTDHVEAPADSWMGWSNGRWEGDTLVVETAGFNGLAWLDRSGNFTSAGLRVVERFTPRSADTLTYEATLEDDSLYTRPWTIRMPLYRRVEPDAQLLEFRCVEFVEDLLYGHLAKPSE
jgi:hypothetical protein